MDIKQIINEILKLEIYCDYFVASGKTFEATLKFFGEMPEDMQEFYKIFNGGLFFGFDFASTQDKKYEYSFKSLNSKKFKKERNISENLIIIADTNYGDFVAYDKEHNVIVVINPEQEKEGCETYKTFTEFLEGFLNDSINLIKEEALEPLV